MRDKKALIILAENADLKAAGNNLEKLIKKSAVFTSYTAGEILGKAVSPEVVTKVTPQDIAASIEKDEALMVCDLGSADAATLNSSLEAVFEAVDRKTVIAVVGKGMLALYGSGINAKAGSLERAATAQDIVPTLAYIADFALTEDCTGAILYQALKTPNMKMEEVGKLKEALSRMESALARDNREPWEKHDCA